MPMKITPQHPQCKMGEAGHRQYGNLACFLSFYKEGWLKLIIAEGYQYKVQQPIICSEVNHYPLSLLNFPDDVKIPCYTAKSSHSIFRILQIITLMTLLVKGDKLCNVLK